MANHKFECFDTERFYVVVGVVRGLGLSFHTIDESMQVVVTSNMSDDNYNTVWTALREYNAQPDALPLP